MSTSYTISSSATFTTLHAKQIASKVATDLKKFQRFYTNGPTDEWIAKYEGELVVLLKEGVLDNVVYGFQRDGKWTEAAVKYTALPNGDLLTDDDPGKIRPNMDVAGASFTSFLTYNNKWLSMSTTGRVLVKNELPFIRSDGSTPPLETGQWANDLGYSAGGRGVSRETVRK